MRQVLFSVASILLCAFTIKLKAQDKSNTIGKVTISSPTAASLGKYGDIPVISFTEYNIQLALADFFLR